MFLSPFCVSEFSKKAPAFEEGGGMESGSRMYKFDKFVNLFCSELNTEILLVFLLITSRNE